MKLWKRVYFLELKFAALVIITKNKLKLVLKNVRLLKSKLRTG